MCEFNDAEAVERALADEQVACVLAEPALTNVGIVLPEDGFHEALRGACDRTGTLLIIDETHTISAGPGGCTRAWGLQPDLVTISKAIAGGIPIGAYGVSADVAARIAALEDPTSSTPGEVLTDAAFDGMSALCERFVAGVRAVIADHELPWSIVPLGARAELAFAAEPPRTGGESAALHDAELEDLLHLFLLNRGVMLTPFHNMALMSPATTDPDVDRHTEVFGAVADALVG